MKTIKKIISVFLKKVKWNDNKNENNNRKGRIANKPVFTFHEFCSFTCSKYLHRERPCQFVSKNRKLVLANEFAKLENERLASDFSKTDRTIQLTVKF